MKKPTKKRAPPKRPKLADPHGGRSIPEWIGASPDTPVPEKVKLRVWQRQGGKDPETGVKMRRSDSELDHDKPLHRGGENRESNLVWRHVGPHKVKSAAEAKIKAKADRQAKAAAGIKPATKKPIEGRGFAPSEKKKGYTDPFPNLPRRICGRVVE